VSVEIVIVLVSQFN